MMRILQIAMVGVAVFFLHDIARGDPNLLGLPEKAFAAKRGAVLLAGGGHIPDAVYDKFVALAGGSKARLVVIPWACQFSDISEVKRWYDGWLSTQVASIKFLEADTREKAQVQRFASVLEDATGVWIAGGKQQRLSALYAGTPIERALVATLERGGVIGGTSAGAAAMSQTMIAFGNPEAVLGNGLGILKNAVVDTHFRQRNREGRLLNALGRNPHHLGLALDEGTAVVIQGNQLEVMGESQLTVCIPQLPASSKVVRRLASGEKAILVNERGAIAIKKQDPAAQANQGSPRKGDVQAAEPAGKKETIVARNKQLSEK